MGLVGNSSELSLADLIQVKGQSPGTCLIQVQGRGGSGRLFLDRGMISHAEYAGLAGEPAAQALLSEVRVAFRAESGAPPPAPNMAAEHRALLLRAAVLSDEQRRGLDARPEPLPEPSPAFDHDLLEPVDELPAPRPAGAFRRRSALVGGLAAAAALGAIAAALFGSVTVRSTHAEAAVRPTPAAPTPSPPAAPLEASALSPPRDELPVLLQGEPPRSPSPEVPLRPTVILRLLVDETGKVARAEVYEPRADLAAFERAAVRAAASFAFRPALRNGAQVAVWINWPVDFL